MKLVGGCRGHKVVNGPLIQAQKHKPEPQSDLKPKPGPKKARKVSWSKKCVRLLLVCG